MGPIPQTHEIAKHQCVNMFGQIYPSGRIPGLLVSLICLICMVIGINEFYLETTCRPGANSLTYILNCVTIGVNSISHFFDVYPYVIKDIHTWRRYI